MIESQTSKDKINRWAAKDRMFRIAERRMYIMDAAKKVAFALLILLSLPWLFRFLWIYVDWVNHARI